MSSQHNQQDFKTTQYQFAAYIRDPEQTAAPDNIEHRRLAVYRELFFNNIEGFIATAFPVLKTLYTPSDWEAMMRDFMIKHHCKTPIFHEISREFIEYLQNERDCQQDPVFMKQLAHYEWVELALSVAEAEFKQEDINQTDCMHLALHTSPLAWSLAYDYPVHQISADFQPSDKSDTQTFLLVYRDRDDKVTFLSLNPVSARLISLLDEGITGEHAAQQISEELQHPTPQAVIDGARTMIQDWLARGILVKEQ